MLDQKLGQPWTKNNKWPVLPFWYRLTRVVPAKGLLNMCVCGRGERKRKVSTCGEVASKLSAEACVCVLEGNVVCVRCQWTTAITEAKCVVCLTPQSLSACATASGHHTLNIILIIIHYNYNHLTASFPGQPG